MGHYMMVKDKEVRTKSIKFVLAKAINAIHQIMGQKEVPRAHQPISVLALKAKTQKVRLISSTTPIPIKKVRKDKLNFRKQQQQQSLNPKLLWVS
jgi:hypothetical protein